MTEPSHPYTTTSTLKRTSKIVQSAVINKKNSTTTIPTPLLPSFSTEKKRRRKRQDPKALTTSLTKDRIADDGSLMSNFDVETFQGEIVYNLDATSAYIINTGGDESLVPLKEHTISGQSTSLVSTHKKSTTTKLKATVSEKSGHFSAVGRSNTTANSKLEKVIASDSDDNTVQTAKSVPASQNPKIHSFRVVSANDAIVSAKCEIKLDESTTITKKIQKPILMCFICKLSFGNAKSFSLHAGAEHHINLQDLELESSLLKREYSSAIIQRNMDEKPQISFLEPLDDDDNDEPQSQSQPQSEIEQQQQQSDPKCTSISEFENKNDSPKISPSYAIDKKSSFDNTEICSKIESNSKSTLEKHFSNEQLGAQTGDRTETDTSSSSLKPTPLTGSIEVSERLGGSPKRCNSSPKSSSAESETPTPTTAVEERVSKSDTNSTDILSSNNVDMDGNDSEKSFSVDQQPSHHKERNSGFTISRSPSPSPVATAGNISAAVADFLQQQLQQLASPLRNIQSSESPPPLPPCSTFAVTSSSSVEASTDSPSYSLPFLSATTLANSSNNNKNAESIYTSTTGALTSDQSTSNSVQFLNELLLQHQLALQHQQIQQNLTCPEHPDFDGIDCKFCELHKQVKFAKIQQQQIRLPQQTSSVNVSTTSISGCSNISTASVTASNICSVSPNIVSVAPTTSNVSNTPIVSAAPSFTIGACSEHINGRPLGVDCVRCEMILTSARMNSGAQISSTRNSCKTLKCPQCNWHYKYQETLEIHMREKHPDGESACGYCLAGQQHPRLARGESYSCGYKPYRCEICNYSTTTKGNLSIHMQSDKHLNNMQELNNSQNMVAAAAAAAAVAAAATASNQSGVGGGGGGVGGNKLGNETNNSTGVTKALMPPSSAACGAQQNLQQPISINSCTTSSGTVSTNILNSPNSNKPRPSFRCDVCSYETSVARNLRIHMTSEKHTHNMAVLQNNIKHIQAFSFLQQQHQQATAAVAAAAVAAASSSLSPQTQGNGTSLSCNIGGGVGVGAGSGAGSLSSGDKGSFLPEVALADMAYNQALMIQLLQQNVAAAAAAQQQQQQQQHILCDSSLSATQTSPTTSIKSQLQRFSPIDKSPTILYSDLNGTELSCLSSTLNSGDISNEAERAAAYGKPDLFPNTIYSCLVCSVFNTNSLDELQQHLLQDRSRNSTSSRDIMILHHNNYICRLCNYKTNLKANFQLHSKTDKHLQKLNFINHIREGGPHNEYKLQFQQQQQFASNTIQLKCNCCDYYTNSIQKLSLHVQHMRHETMQTIYHHLRHLLMSDDGTPSSENLLLPLSTDGAAATTSDLAPKSLEKSKQEHDKSMNKAKALFCQLCSYTALNLLDMIRHVKSLRHLQVEQFICLQRSSENLDGPSLDDIFKLIENDSQMHETTSYTAKGSLEKTDGDSYQSKNSTPLVSSSTFPGLSPVQPAFLMNSTFNEVINTRSDEDGAAKMKIESSTSTSSYFSSINPNERKSIPPQIDNLEPMSTFIYKCNINMCEFLAQNKLDLESHHEEAHPNCEQNFVTIPTNAAAIRAFQAAVAAATAAAAAAASCFAGNQTSLDFSQEDDGCPVAIKKERLDPERAEAESEDMQETDSIMQNVEEISKTGSPVEHQNTTSVLPSPTSKIQCPLCQECFSENAKDQTLESHLLSVHSVSNDGLMRLLQLVNKKNWQSPSKTSENQLEAKDELKATTTAIDSSAESKDDYFCQQCRIGFETEQKLLQHAQKEKHFLSQDNGECICLALDSNQRSCNLSFASLPAMFAHYRSCHMRNNDGNSGSSNLVISERHVYKYRCKQCSLAFKTEAKLNTHALYHTMRDATKCSQCQRNFRSTQALQKHIEQTHLNKEQPTTPNISSLLEHSLNDINKKSPPVDIAMDMGEQSQKSPSALIPPPMQSVNALNLTENEESVKSIQQQQNSVAAITAELLKQQQKCRSDNLEGNRSASPLQQTLPLDSLPNYEAMGSILKQENIEHKQGLANICNLQTLQSLHSFQGLQSLQQMQHHVPQLAAAAAASGMPMNPVDMINLMQFHHLMSLNFMNLAPPLIFGGNTTTATTTRCPNNKTMPNSPNPTPLSVATASEISQHVSATTPTSTQSSGTAALETNSQYFQHQQQKQQTSPAIPTVQLSTNQKRARTRITDEQLKILRAHFDINNSPSEESILEMSEKANLPMKVVKHWFRNTLFKERQRNKDSPYNFNNPPSTTLNLEEYERTGHAKVTSLSESNVTNIPAVSSAETKVENLAMEVRESSPVSAAGSSEASCNFMSTKKHPINSSNSDINQLQRATDERLTDNQLLNSNNFSNIGVTIKTEPRDEPAMEVDRELQQPQPSDHQLMASTAAMAMLRKHQRRLSEMLNEHEKEAPEVQQAHDQLQQHRPPVGTSPAVLSQVQSAVQQGFYSSYDTKSESGSSEILSRPPTPNSASTIALHPYPNINDLLGQQLENMPSSSTSSSNPMGPPKNFQLTTGSVINSKGACGGSSFEKTSPSSQFDTNSNSSTGSSTSSGKRANRTRFTDYQIKVLQEFFENNSYPKDSDLEYLSKLLLLSPRVIVVWFQNARQKQRKIYENQPNNSLYETEEKKQNINYACKKCSLVFQRYYELIRHQKNHCFKEENNKKSAKAQIAAAQIAQNLSSEDSNSSMDISQQHHHQQHAAASAVVAAIASSAAAVANASSSNSPSIPGSSIMSGNGGFNLMGSSSQYSAFSKNSTLADTYSPSTTPTPPSQHRDRSNSIEQRRHQQSTPVVKPHNHECDKCKISFAHLEHLREHQLLHIVSPGMFPIDSSLQNQNSQSQLLMETSPNVYGPFSSILQNLQQAVHQQQQQQQQQVRKKRKYSETSSNADDQSSTGGISSSTGDIDTQSKRYEFLYHYFMQNESNNEIKEQFHNQRLSQAHDMDMDIEFLMTFYQQCELKKRSSYEFLLQYYIKNEHITSSSFVEESKPNFDFLLQYYQLHESKKFFQLDASPQPVHDPDETSSSRHFKSQKFNEKKDGGKSSKIYHQQLNNAYLSEHGQENSTCRFIGIHDTTSSNRSSVAGFNFDGKNGKYIEANPIVDHTTTPAGSEECDKIKDDKAQSDTSDQDENIDFKDKNNTKNNKQHIMSDEKSSSTAGNIVLHSKQDFRYENMEDFLEATMIENNLQSITFNQISSPTPNSQTSIENDEKPPISTTNAMKSSNNCENKQNKRLRTTILPDQLNFLYECYQNESNPSRKMLEEIAKKVNLKKRVVQVWFQNARAKDKKSRNQRYIPQISDDSNTNTVLKASSHITRDTNDSTKIVDYKIRQFSEFETEEPYNLSTVQDVLLKDEDQRRSSSTKNPCFEVRTENNNIGDGESATALKNNDNMNLRCKKVLLNEDNILVSQNLNDMVVQHNDLKKNFYVMSSMESTPEISGTVNVNSQEPSRKSMCNNHVCLKQHNQNMLNINFNADIADTENDDGDQISRNIRNGSEVPSHGHGHNQNEIMKQMFKFNQITVIGGK